MNRQITMPPDYAQVLTYLNRKGDFKDSVLKVGIPRSDLKITIEGKPVPTALGFGGWIALTKATKSEDVMMGDIVLQESEVHPVMSMLLSQGLEVTALHNHFFYESPRIFYLHVHGFGKTDALAEKIKPALDLLPPPAPANPNPSPPGFDTNRIAAILGTPGETNGPVYKVTIGRPDIKIKEKGAVINARMGLNTWAAFYGTESEAIVAGDVAVLENELPYVLRILTNNGLNIVAIHHHMTEIKPTIIFLHYWGKGEASKLAQGIQDAVNILGRKMGKGHN
jgi:hypothetical protein